MKKIGIHVDNYKVEKFKEELNKQGFTDFECKPYTKSTTVIFVQTTLDKVKDVQKLCEDLQNQFNKVKSKFN